MFKTKKTLLFVLLFLIQTSFLFSGVNKISYQGTLMDALGEPIDTAGQTITVTFKLYDSNGQVVWTQTKGVVFDEGLFNVNLENLDNLDFSKQYNLGVQVAGDDHEMSPRQALGSSPYCLGSLGNFDVCGKLIVNGNVGIGTREPSKNFQVNGSSGLYGNTWVSGILAIGNNQNAGIARFGANGLGFRVSDIANAVVINDACNVGIGSSEPSKKLVVGGTTELCGDTWVSGLLAIGSNQNAGIARFGANGIGIRTGDISDRVVITDAGNVGIGTTAPNEKLEVIGKVKAQAFITCSPDIRKETGLKNPKPKDYLKWALKDAKKPIMPYKHFPSLKRKEKRYKRMNKRRTNRNKSFEVSKSTMTRVSEKEDKDKDKDEDEYAEEEVTLEGPGYFNTEAEVNKEFEKYSKDISKIAIGIANWAEEADKKLDDIKELKEEIKSLKKEIEKLKKQVRKK